MNDWVLPYTPRDFMIPFHQRTERNAFLICHRRAGKTVGCIAELVIRALYTKKKNAQYAYIAPFRSQAKAVAWQYLVDMTEGIATEVKVSELSIMLPNGAKIWLSGSDNVNALRGLYLDGAVLDEYAQCRPDLLEAVILPCLLDRKGWLVVIGTAYGRLNAFFTLYEQSKESDAWFHADIKVTESGIIPEEEQERLKLAVSDAKWKQEMMNDFSAELIGTYYSAQVNELEASGQISSDINYNRDIPVHAAMDIGRKDATVIWFWQETPHGINVIDYYMNNGLQAQHYIDFMQGKPYTYATINLPHDAKAMTFSTDKSALEQFVDAWLNTDTRVQLVPKLSVSDGIEAVRQTLRYSHFNIDTCYYGIECLRVYRKSWDAVKQVFSATPLHDYACFAGDTLVNTPLGQARIDTLTKGSIISVGGECVALENVYTREADTITLHFECGTNITCTREHKFFTTRGVVLAGDLRYNDQIHTDIEARKWSQTACGIRKAFIENSMAISTDTGRNVIFTSVRKAVGNGFYTARSTVTSMAKSLLGLRLQGLMGTLKTSPPLIWSRKNATKTAINLPNTRMSCSTANGTTAILKTSTTTTPCPVKRQNECSTEKSTAPITATQQGGTFTTSTMIRAIITPAIWLEYLNQTTPSTMLRQILGWVAMKIKPNCEKQVNLRLLYTTEGARQRVYDINVPKHHAYIANGALVSNSDPADAFRYLAVMANMNKLPAPDPNTAAINAIIANGEYTLDKLHADRQQSRAGNSISRARI